MHQVHIFTDTNGGVAYLQTQDSNGEVQLSFNFARSQVVQTQQPN